ncbi:MAG: hypothetical protein LBC85_06550, partial [Fibromonadaceae bacterium]|nr:hypothetical protein [Fibromonadaceae bacterium]
MPLVAETGTGGVILQEMTAEALAEAVCEIAKDKAQMQVLGAKGRAYAERFSWDSCFERQREFFAG